MKIWIIVQQAIDYKSKKYSTWRPSNRVTQLSLSSWAITKKEGKVLRVFSSGRWLLYQFLAIEDRDNPIGNLTGKIIKKSTFIPTFPLEFHSSSISLSSKRINHTAVTREFLWLSSSRLDIRAKRRISHNKTRTIQTVPRVWTLKNTSWKRKTNE